MKLSGRHRLWVLVAGAWMLPVIGLGSVEAWRRGIVISRGEVYSHMSRWYPAVPLDYMDVVAAYSGAVRHAAPSEEARLTKVLVEADLSVERRAEARLHYFTAANGKELDDALRGLGLSAMTRAAVASTAAEYRGEEFWQEVMVEGDPLLFGYDLSDSERSRICSNYLQAKRSCQLRNRVNAFAVVGAIATGPPLALYALGLWWTFVWGHRGPRAGR
jgi:hypothetical protein